MVFKTTVLISRLTSFANLSNEKTRKTVNISCYDVLFFKVLRTRLLWDQDSRFEYHKQFFHHIFIFHLPSSLPMRHWSPISFGNIKMSKIYWNTISVCSCVWAVISPAATALVRSSLAHSVSPATTEKKSLQKVIVVPPEINQSLIPVHSSQWSYQCFLQVANHRSNLSWWPSKGRSLSCSRKYLKKRFNFSKSVSVCPTTWGGLSTGNAID